MRGQAKYVVMSHEQYTHLRECELEAALAQSRADIAEGRFVIESPQAHVDRIMGRSKSNVAVPANKKLKRVA